MVTDYGEDDGNTEIDCWADDLAVTWALDCAVLEVDDWERNESMAEDSEESVG